ncbi:MAG: hypothetical protein ACREBS_07950 [Nitrososphaerales archaeon]
MLEYQILNNGHPKLESRIQELRASIAPLFPELRSTTLRIRMKRLRRAIAEYDYRALRIDIDPSRFEPDKDNLLPSVLAHETMHAVQHLERSVPFGERSCDVFMLARLPPELYPKTRDFYVKVPQRILSYHPELIKEIAREALKKRERGIRNYIVWFESELKAARK